MESLFREGKFGRTIAPFFLFERAMRLHAPDVWEEQKINPLRWGEKYGFPIIEEERDGKKVPRWEGAITRSTIKFHHVERFPEQTPDDYMNDLKAAFAKWAAELYEVEKEKYRAEKKRWPKMDQVHHAEWFVLNHVRGWTHSAILDWNRQSIIGRFLLALYRLASKTLRTL